MNQGEFMHRRRLLLSIVAALALALAVFTTTPAQAVTSDRSARSSAGTVVQRSTPPRWATQPGTTTVKLPGTSNVSVDWQWLKAGWEIKFTKSETRNIAEGTSQCASLLAFMPAPLPAVAASCAIVSAFAWTVQKLGKCMTAWVPLSIIFFQLGARSC
jgi:hypothetical protein